MAFVFSLILTDQRNNMSSPFFSFVIPVFNRPLEVQELLQSMTTLSGNHAFEVVIVEDGSTQSSSEVVQSFNQLLNIQYLTKSNTGPGDSRNYGMKRAKGACFLILDSDVILPENYLDEVSLALATNPVDCFGGPDATHDSFSKLQKAIDFAMTSLLTTGGIRGSNSSNQNFQPRSFNMGLSRKAFELSGGFGQIHPGEDPDLVLRLRKLGFETALFPKAFVFHKRRISWSKFFKQVNSFGKVRPILNSWHPESIRFTYWLPSLYLLGIPAAAVLMYFGFWQLTFVFGVYQLAILISATITTKSLSIALMALFAANIQFLGYGIGFLINTISLTISRKNVEELFPNQFFKLPS